MDEAGIKSAVPSPAEPVPDEYDLLCEHCGYSLIGLTGSRRCPECGVEFDPTQLPLARVPWLYRKRLGRWPAYVQTVNLIMLSPRKFAIELCRPVRISVVDAKAFRNLTGWIAAFTTFCITVLLAILLMATYRKDGLMLLALAGGTMLGVRFFVHLATDMPTFIWRGPNPGNPHELSPLQHYASAPVCLLGFAALMAELPTAASFVIPGMIPKPTETGWITASAFTGSLLLVFLLTSLVFMRVATGCSALRMAMLGIYLVFHWSTIAVISGLVGMLMTILIGLIGSGIFEAFGIHL